MYGDMYHTKYMGKSTDTFEWLRFGCHKTYVAGKASHTELFMLHGEI